MEPSPAEPAKKSVYLSAQKVTIAAVVSFLFLLFGAIVVFANHFGSGTVAPSPTPGPDGLFQAGSSSEFQKNPQQVKGANTQQQSAQDYNVPVPEKSAKPTPKASSTPTPTTTPSPTTAPTSTPSPSPTPSPESTPAPSPLSVSCSADPNEVNEGVSITWKATASGGNGSFSYSWSGSDSLTGSDKDVSKSYSESGLKNASVKVSSNGSDVTSTCQATVKDVP